MKIIKKLYFKNLKDNSKHSIIDVSSKRLKKIINEFKKDNNTYLEIEGKYYALQKNNERHDYYNCAFFNLCSCNTYTHEHGYDGYNCLSWTITKDEYHTFRQMEEYEIIFNGDYYEENI